MRGARRSPRLAGPTLALALFAGAPPAAHGRDLCAVYAALQIVLDRRLRAAFTWCW